MFNDTILKQLEKKFGKTVVLRKVTTDIRKELKNPEFAKVYTKEVKKLEIPHV